MFGAYVKIKQSLKRRCAACPRGRA